MQQFNIAINGQKAVDAARAFIGPACYRGIYNHGKRLWGGYSATTMRHVNELLMQEGFPKLSARAWRAMEVGKFYSPSDVPALEKNLK